MNHLNEIQANLWYLMINGNNMSDELRSKIHNEIEAQMLELRIELSSRA